MTGDLIAAAILDVLHAGPSDRGWPEHPDECERCGSADGALVPMIHAVNRGRIRAHADCGQHAGYVPEVPDTDGCPLGFACLACRTPAPACDMDDGCGAREGEPCEIGCPSLADGNDLTVAVVGTEAGPMCLTRCTICTGEGRFPVLEADAVRRLVLEHREHVREVGR